MLVALRPDGEGVLLHPGRLVPVAAAEAALHETPQRAGRTRGPACVPLLSELKTELGRVYGRRLRGVRLRSVYHSAGRLGACGVRVLIVLDRVSDYAAELERTSDLISRLSVRHRLGISRVFVAEAESM